MKKQTARASGAGSLGEDALTDCDVAETFPPAVEDESGTASVVWLESPLVEVRAVSRRGTVPAAGSFTIKPLLRMSFARSSLTPTATR